MATTSIQAQQAEQVVKFKSKTEKGITYSIPLSQIVEIVNTNEDLDEQFTDQMIDAYNKVFPGNPYTPAVLVVKSKISDAVLFIQYKEENHIYSFRMLSEGEWLQATSKGKWLIEKAITPKD